MDNERKQNRKKKYAKVIRWLSIVTIILLAVVASIPGVMRVMYRADAQVALGHAKSLRTAFEIASTEAYGNGTTYFDASCEGGVKESTYVDILDTTKIPGDFWVTQVSKDRHYVTQFVYQEGEFTVWYTSEPKKFEVYHNDTYIETKAR